MKTTFTNWDDIPVTLHAEHIADALGLSRSGAYQLLRSETFPTIKIGKRLLVTKDAFLHWLDENKAKAIKI